MIAFVPPGHYQMKTFVASWESMNASFINLLSLRSFDESRISQVSLDDLVSLSLRLDFCFEVTLVGENISFTILLSLRSFEDSRELQESLEDLVSLFLTRVLVGEKMSVVFLPSLCSFDDSRELQESLVDIVSLFLTFDFSLEGVLVPLDISFVGLLYPRSFKESCELKESLRELASFVGLPSLRSFNDSLKVQDSLKSDFCFEDVLTGEDICFINLTSLRSFDNSRELPESTESFLSLSLKFGFCFEDSTGNTLFASLECLTLFDSHKISNFASRFLSSLEICSECSIAGGNTKSSRLPNLEGILSESWDNSLQMAKERLENENQVMHFVILLKKINTPFEIVLLIGVEVIVDIVCETGEVSETLPCAGYLKAFKEMHSTNENHFIVVINKSHYPWKIAAVNATKGSERTISMSITIDSTQGVLLDTVVYKYLQITIWFPSQKSDDVTIDEEIQSVSEAFASNGIPVHIVVK
uniref:Uncharacterized protein n=1 Tax=Glossina austeni TaxID=7395 RepID=A0A1A9V1M7_GLOAU